VKKEAHLANCFLILQIFLIAHWSDVHSMNWALDNTTTYELGPRFELRNFVFPCFPFSDDYSTTLKFCVSMFVLFRRLLDYSKILCFHVFPFTTTTRLLDYSKILCFHVFPFTTTTRLLYSSCLIRW
jgi:hypothetical protein